MTQSEKSHPSIDYSHVNTTPIAIIGMGSLFPQAHNPREYWENILRKVDCVIDVPASRWKIEDYYDPNPTAPDKTYCKRGAFLPDVDFDPMEFGLPPNILEVTDVSQLLSLVVARDALEDAGYGEGTTFNRDATGVVLGVVGMSSKLFTPLMNRLQYPVWEKVLKSCGLSADDTQKVVEKMKLAYVGWEENAFPGAIGNVIAGRICNRFDLGGINCVVDAACASSLAALRLAVAELIEGRADMMITGGVDADNSINSYMCFSKTPAFSKGEHVRTFDAESDGMMVGEGIGMIVLKRLADAERDGDRVYAVIKGIGTSSDGRFKSIYAPRPAGQAKAVRRAYAEAGFAPQTVGLIEAHGTGTMAGDPAEFAGMCEVFGENNPRKQSIALGSVKSQIAHTKAAAGIASMMKISLALHHKVLPATINVTRPNPKFDIENTPFYINTETRPWIRAKSQPPRRAGVSSFGFGGTNFHIVMEEYKPEQDGAYRSNPGAQSILLQAENEQQLLDLCRRELQTMQSETGAVRFVELTEASKNLLPAKQMARVGFVAETAQEAAQALQICLDTLSEKRGVENWEHPKGIFYRQHGMDAQGKVVALFSGQGSQYVNMGRELAVNFPPVRQVFAEMDELFLQDGAEPLSARVYPRPTFDNAECNRFSEALTRTENAQPAIGAFSMGLYKLLQAAGFQADFTAGHSFGELTALWAGGVLSDTGFLRLAKARGKAMTPPADPTFDAGTMMAVKGDVEKVRALFANDAEVTLANWNSRNQMVIAGSKAVMARAKATLEASGFGVMALPVSAAFHTPLVEHAQKPFAEAIAAEEFHKPMLKVYANGTAKPHAKDPKQIRMALEKHILNPVLFRNEIDAIYAEGGRIFVEFGPKNVLTNLVGNILEGQPHLAVALNANAKKDSDRQLREAVLNLRVAGLPMTEMDRYARPAMKVSTRKKSAVTVTLNGGAYVTEKTRRAFENALQDGFKISQSAPSIIPPTAAPTNGNGKVHSVPTLVAAAPIPMVNQPAEVSMNVDSSVVERLLADYQAHQSETLRLHEQYLRTEEEYARAFANLTTLQTELVSKGSSNVGEMSAILPLFESLERSMVRFHDHQAETLRIHQQYMQAQEQFAQNFTQTATHGTVQQTAAPVVRAARPIITQPAAPTIPVRTNGAVAQPVAIQQPAPVVAAPALVVQTPVSVIAAPVVPQPVTPAASPATGISVETLTNALLNVVSEKTGYPTETLELDMDMEADLGIDSIKRVEILGAMQTQFPQLPKPDAAALAELHSLRQIVAALGANQPAEAAKPALVAAPAMKVEESARAASIAAPEKAVSVGGVSAAQLSEALMQVVSEKTGYPVETLEPDMNMEADLGIDSIKRVEILGAIQAQFPQLPKPDAAALAELCTLSQIGEYLLGGASSDGSAEPEAQAVAESSSPFDWGVEQGVVERKTLPLPDAIHFDLPAGHICLVAENGTPAAALLVEKLQARGWQVIVLRFPVVAGSTQAQGSYSAPVFELPDWTEAGLQATLAEIRAKYGAVAVFVHLALTGEENEAADFSAESRAGLKLIFLAAKHLKMELNDAAKEGRAAFIAVIQLDGEFGLSGESSAHLMSGGLFGLVKTLNLEWEGVYCKAVDLSPALADEVMAQCVLTEMDDPNRLVVEVGYNALKERSTLIVNAIPVTGGER